MLRFGATWQSLWPNIRGAHSKRTHTHTMGPPYFIYMKVVKWLHSLNAKCGSMLWFFWHVWHASGFMDMSLLSEETIKGWIVIVCEKHDVFAFMMRSNLFRLNIDHKNHHSYWHFFSTLTEHHDDRIFGMTSSVVKSCRNIDGKYTL